MDGRVTDSLATRLRQTLEHDIVAGSLRPGERLDEISLARRFDVSRTPVREALNQLASAGLVEVRRNRGAVVASMGLKDLVEMFEVMAELEGMCGRLAARRLTEAQGALLRAAFEAGRREVEAKDHEAYYRANVAFHEAIYQGSRNGFLSQQTKALRNRLAPYRRLQLRAGTRLAESFAEHEAILDAILSGDAVSAERLLRGHVVAQSESFADFIASLPADMVAGAA